MLDRSGALTPQGYGHALIRQHHCCCAATRPFSCLPPAPCSTGDKSLLRCRHQHHLTSLWVSNSSSCLTKTACCSRSEMRVGGKGKPWRTCFCLCGTLPFTGTRGLVPFGTCRAMDSNGTLWWVCPCAAPVLGSCRHATGQTAKAAGQTAEVPGSHPTAALLSSSQLRRAALSSLAWPLLALRDDGTCPFTIHCYQLPSPT